MTPADLRAFIQRALTGGLATLLAFGTILAGASPVWADSGVIDMEAQTFSMDEDELLVVPYSDFVTGPGPYQLFLFENALNGTAGASNHWQEIFYFPDSNWNGTDWFTMVGCDANNSCTLVTHTVIVASVNDAPVVELHDATIDEDASLVIDNSFIRTLSDDSGTDTLTASPAGATNGSYVDGEDLVFYPTPDFNGTASLSMNFCDNEGACTTGTIQITVLPTPDSPVAQDASLTVAEDEILELSYDEFASDADGEDLTLTVLSPPTHGTMSVFDADQELRWTPPAEYNGSDSAIVEACDPDNTCAQASLTLTVTPVNDEPRLLVSEIQAVEDERLVLHLDDLVLEVDGEDIASFDVVLDPTKGTWEHLTTLPSGPTPEGGHLAFTPAPNFAGTFQGAVIACDTAHSCANADLTFVVAPVNDAPEIDNPELTVAEDEVLVADFNDVASDIDGDTLTFTILTTPDHGEIAVDSAAHIITWTPESDFNGTDEVSIEVCDPDGACDTATLHLMVTPVADVPRITGELHVLEDETTIFSIDELAFDIDGHQITSFDLVLADPTLGVWESMGASSYSFTPSPEFSGNVDAVAGSCDDHSDCVSDQSLVIIVEAVNDAPSLDDIELTTQAETVVEVDVLDLIDDPDDETHTLTVVTPPDHGSVDEADNGALLYQPEPWYAGTDSFEVKVVDDEGAEDTAVVSVEVVPSTTSEAVTLTTNENTDGRYLIFDLGELAPLDGSSFGSLARVSSPVLAPLASLIAGFEIEVTMDPTHGEVAVAYSGEVVYHPAPYFNGEDSFSIEVCSQYRVCVIYDVSVTVSPVPTAPWFVRPGDTSQVPAQVTEMIVKGVASSPLPGLEVFSPDGGELLFVLTGGTLPPGVSLTSTGTFEGAPAAAGEFSADVEVCVADTDLCGSVGVVFQIADSGSDSDEQTTTDTTTDTPADSAAELPRTGADLTWLFWAAVVMLAAGVALTNSDRRLES